MAGLFLDMLAVFCCILATLQELLFCLAALVVLAPDGPATSSMVEEVQKIAVNIKQAHLPIGVTSFGLKRICRDVPALWETRGCCFQIIRVFHEHLFYRGNTPSQILGPTVM